MKNLLIRLAFGGALAALTLTGAFAQRQQQQQNNQNNRATQMAGTAVQNVLDTLAAQSDPLLLIFRKDVQHDLELDLGQRNRFDNMHDRQLAEVQQFRTQQRQNRGRTTGSLADIQAKQRKETQDKIDELLTKDQKKRLDQIALQLQGPSALMTAPIQKTLGITDEQRLRINQIQADRNTKIQELQASVAQRTMRPQDLQSRIDQIQKETGEALREMLTEEQQVQLDKLFGKPFKVGG